MASIETRKNKNGDITSYRIVVSCGYDSSGKKIVHKTSWKPDLNRTAKQNEKALQKAATEFEQAIELGFQIDQRQTFEEYAEYALEQKAMSGVKDKTIIRYKELLTRINAEIGALKLSDIRPQHLNNLYRKLSAEGGRKNSERAVATDALIQLKAIQKLSNAEIARRAGVAAATVSALFLGKTIQKETALAIANAVNMPLKDAFVVTEENTPLAAKTVLEHHRLISSILAMAEKEMLVKYNAAEKATPPKAKKSRPNYLQPEDIQEILAALDKENLKWRALITTMISTGCRRGEVAGLKWEKIDFDSRLILFDTALLYTAERGIYESTTKTDDMRLLKVPQETLNLLAELQADQKELYQNLGIKWRSSGYVFTRDNGLPMHPDTITGWLANFSKRHDLPHINPHAFRHTVASVLIANGTDIVTVSKQLGHASVTTTESFYSHIINETKAKASECIADVLLRKG